MLPTLYSLRSDGKVQGWHIEVRDNTYRTHVGIVPDPTPGRDPVSYWDSDSAAVGVSSLPESWVTSEWTSCKGKNIGRSNETTPAAQAESQARSLWQKKVDSGYKVDVREIADVGFFEPMLAKEYTVGCVIFPVYAQPKLDGVRCIVTAKGMFSRNGKPNVSAPHVRRALEPIFQKSPDAIFDGELYADKFANDFNTVVSLAKQGKPTAEDLARSEELLQYHIYDFPGATGTFGERWRSLGKTMNGFKHRSIVGVTTHLVTTQERLDELYGEWIEAGYEGQMVRVDAPYENKRTKVLLKRKEFKSDEFPVLGIEEGNGNWSGVAKVLVCALPDGRQFRATIKANRETTREMLKKPVPVEATVKFFNYTPDGIPRFPVAVAWFDGKRDI